MGKIFNNTVTFVQLVFKLHFVGYWGWLEELAKLMAEHKSFLSLEY